ncbi:hypothetical protein A6U90_09690 [Agrobacterium tumefaciens]|nr:hypothetical protein A6U90_09690 [Agrobacterium tumefaciens]
MKTLNHTSELSEQVHKIREWLRDKDVTYCEQVWVEALGCDPSEYDVHVAHRMSIVLSTYCGWLKGGDRARIDGRQHWMYYPSGHQASVIEPLDIGNVDQKLVREFLKSRRHTITAAAVLQNLFGVDPNGLSREHASPIRKIERAFTKGGWQPTGLERKVGNVNFRVYGRTNPMAQFEDVLGA